MIAVKFKLNYVRRLGTAFGVFCFLFTSQGYADDTFNFESLDREIYSRWFSPSSDKSEYISQDKNYASLYALQNGRVGARISNMKFALKNLLRGEFRQFYSRITHSLLLSLPLAADVTTDLTASYQARDLINKRIGSRVQFCTINLSSALTHRINFTEFLNPLNHIAFLIDGHIETRDPNAGYIFATEPSAALCTQVVIDNEIQERLIIEKLSCINQNYREKFNYHFFRNNCGGFTYDIAKMVGLIPIGVPNLGIGSHYFRPSVDLIEPIQTEVQNHCEKHINKVFKILHKINSQAEMDVNDEKYLASNIRSFSSDLTMELISVLIRNEKYELLIRLIDLIYINYLLKNVYFSSTNHANSLIVKPKFKSFIQDLFPKSINWSELNKQKLNEIIKPIFKAIQNEVQNAH